jgi:muramoyltetrapeptide carboxypeptidase LdcA involved in peptidoglycan recycling
MAANPAKSTRSAAWASPAARAADIHAAFADPDIKAVIASIGGADFGHTEPQHVIPSGGTVTVDGGARQIQVTY